MGGRVAPEGGQVVPRVEAWYMCPWTWCCECCLPSATCCLVSCCTCCRPWRALEAAGSCFARPRLRSAQAAQSWLLRHPAAFCVLNRACCCGLLEAVCAIPDATAPSTTYYTAAQREFGGAAFVDNVKLELGVPELMERLLQEPTHRAAHLGQLTLDAAKLPRSWDGSSLYALALDSADDPGLKHSRLRALFFAHVLNADAADRQDSDVARRFLTALRDGLRDRRRADWAGVIAEFCLRYEHWVFFGIDLADEEYDLVFDYYFAPDPGLGKASITLWYAKWIGGLATGAHGRSLGAKRQRLKRLYADHADAFRTRTTTATTTTTTTTTTTLTWPDDEETTLPLDDFLEFLILVIGLAALQGPKGILTTLIVGSSKWVPVPENFTLDLSNRDAVRLYILETMRLKPSVFGATTLLRAPLVVPVEGRDRVFPAGCPVHQNFVLHGRATDAWGPDAQRFDPDGRASDLWGPKARLCVFNAVGDATCGGRAHGRICPGRDFSLDMLIDALQVIYGPGGITPHWKKEPKQPANDDTQRPPKDHHRAPFFHEADKVK